MTTTPEKGKTPSFAARLPNPSAERPVVDGETLYTIKEAALATGHTVRSLQVYNSHRRCQKYLGPKPTKIPFNSRIWYRGSDIELYLSQGLTGAPGDPNADEAKGDL